MLPASRRSIVPVVLLTVLLAGCTGLIGTGDADPAADLADRAEAAEPPASIEAVHETTYESPDGTTTVAERIWLRDDGVGRTEAVDGSYVIVDDGETVWHHDLETEDATSLELEPAEESRIERLHAEGRRHLERLEATAVEETTVDGRDAHRVAFEPPREDVLERSIDVLVGDTTYRIPLERSPDPPAESAVEAIEVVYDDETLFPLAYRLDAGEEAFEVRFEAITFDAEIDDETFAFEPPEGEDSVEEIVLPSFEEYVTVADAEESVPFEVAEPAPAALPEGVELDGITRAEYPDENRTQVSLSYRNGDEGPVTVTTGDAPRGYAADGESVAVGDAEGRLERTGQGTELEWACDGLHYSIYADDAFQNETALEVAESVGCESAADLER